MIIPAIFKKKIQKKSPLIKIYAAQILGPLSPKLPVFLFYSSASTHSSTLPSTKYLYSGGFFFLRMITIKD